MITLQAEAHAKLNLTLDVLGKRPDGYHDLRMVMQEIALGDTITLRLGTGEEWLATGNRADLPRDDGNLALKAARLFLEAAALDCGGLFVDIQKRTPVCAGMGGGSADGAAVLRLLWEHYGRPVSEQTLYRLAEQVGSDVPFALFGGTALAEEKGQILTRLPSMPACHIVLCKPDFPLSTPALFRAIDGTDLGLRPDHTAMLEALRTGDLGGVGRNLRNVFEPLATELHPELAEIRRTLLDFGALGAAMTGSGPTMFGLYADAADAQAAFGALQPRYGETFLTEPV